MRATILAFGLALTITTAASPAFAQGTALQPRVTNGRLNPQPAGANLDSTFRRPEHC